MKRGGAPFWKSVQSQLHFSNPWHQAALLAGAFARRLSSWRASRSCGRPRDPRRRRSRGSLSRSAAATQRCFWLLFCLPLDQQGFNVGQHRGSHGPFKAPQVVLVDAKGCRSAVPYLPPSRNASIAWPSELGCTSAFSGEVLCKSCGRIVGKPLSCLALVGAPGLEPGTFCSQSRRSSPLRWGPIFKAFPGVYVCFSPAFLMVSPSLPRQIDAVSGQVSRQSRRPRAGPSAGIWGVAPAASTRPPPG